MRKLCGGLVAVAVAVALTGCVPGQVTETPTPTVAAPVFASEAEALAAAEEAYGKYLAVGDLISSEGGANPGRIKDLVTKEQFKRELQATSYFVDNDVHSSGATKFDSFSLQEYSEANGKARVTAYTCGDVSGIRVLTSDGTDATPQRAERVPLQVGFESSGDRLLIASSDVWDGKSFC